LAGEPGRRDASHRDGWPADRDWIHTTMNPAERRTARYACNHAAGLVRPWSAKTCRSRFFCATWHSLGIFCFILSVAQLPSISRVRAAEAIVPVSEKLAGILAGGVPSSIEELRLMQDQVRAVTTHVLPATVGVEVGTAQGSGVIITPDGFVLTAAHVIGQPNREATLFLHDGRRLRARTLGTFRSLDAGLLKIEASAGQGGPWPFVPIGDSARLVPGQWCLATGHPGGLQSSQSPAVRLGRILRLKLGSDEMQSISTDCTLIGGDSGGPLLDMYGRVIGIHSRIGEPLNANLHVPINVYRESWTRLVKGDNWGYVPGQQPFIGVEGDPSAKEARLRSVFPDSPAAQAGLLKGDVVVRFNGKTVNDFVGLQRAVAESEPGASVSVVVQRDGRKIELLLVLGSKLALEQ
jgi:serine protease Do